MLQLLIKMKIGTYRMLRNGANYVIRDVLEEYVIERSIDDKDIISEFADKNVPGNVCIIAGLKVLLFALFALPLIIIDAILCEVIKLIKKIRA